MLAPDKKGRGAAGHSWPADRASLERDTEIDFFTASGPGGQHRNRSRTGVRLRHHPTGMVVVATERRSQRQNLEVAYQRLAERLEALNRTPKPRRPTGPSKASQRKRRRSKVRQSQKKTLRRNPLPEDDR